MWKNKGLPSVWIVYIECAFETVRQMRILVIDFINLGSLDLGYL